MKYVIKCHDWWFADWKDGDPPRTLILASAKAFNQYDKAESYLSRMKKLNPHRNLEDSIIMKLEEEK